MNVIHNVKIILENEILVHKALIFNEKIANIINESDLHNYNFEKIIDGEDMYLSPGFIDIHVHGCASYDVMDAAPENLDIISQSLAKTGVTSFLPTTMTMKISEIERALEKIRKNMNLANGAQILGCHLEGPFINELFKGAQDGTYIIPPNYDLIEKYKDIIKIITLAPEKEGSMKFIKYCVNNNIIVSIGHTNANYEIAMAAIENGAKHITHIFNAMTPLNHRSPGTVGAAFLGDVTCELIADNIHVHPAVQNILVKMKGYDKVILITDALRACMMENGTYDLGGQDVIVNNGEARLENGTLAGSVLTLNIALKNIIKNTNAPLNVAVQMVTKNPATLLNAIDKKGTIEIGKNADLTIFDDEFNIHYTLTNGKIVYRS